MTYFQILGIFILPPLLLLAVFVPRDLWQRLWRGSGGVDWIAYLAILAHVLVALIYTTPWDNYLVATKVWWYDSGLVSGLTLGWVPIEEYTFFILQTLLTGLWTLALMRGRFPRATQMQPNPGLRRWSAAAVALAWALSITLLLSGWKPGVYLGLILSWALAPVLLQVMVGADILWVNRRLLAVAILPPTLYLWLVDSLALSFGTWTIDPHQTTGLGLGVIPLEEMLFFFATNLIVGFGITLMLSPLLWRRADEWLRGWRTWSGLPDGQRMVALATNNRQRWRLGLGAAFLLGLAVLILMPVALWGVGDELYPALATVGVLAQFAVTLSVLAGGWPAQRTRYTLGVVLTGAWLVEWVGVHTGLPFGNYQYSAALQPQLGGVPILIPLAWFMLLAPAWTIAEMGLRRHQSRLGKAYRPLFAVVAALAFTAWDLYLDPQMTARGLWSWATPGAYFGIPLVNFAGWWLTAFVLTMAVRPQNLPHRPLFLMYMLTWLVQAILLGIFWGQPGPALAGFLGMGGFVAWAGLAQAKMRMFSSGTWRDISRVSFRSL